jgi:hypothetical protein
MTVHGYVRFVHPGLPGENSWCSSRAAAEAAARRRLTKLPPGYRLACHANPRLGAPHYHLVSPQGDPFYAHFFYSQPASAAGNKAVTHWQETLAQQGFIAAPQFVRGFRQGLRARGRRLSPAQFRDAFARACHYRPQEAGNPTRIAVWQGIAMLYRLGNQTSPHITLFDVLPAGATAVAVPTRPPFTQTGAAEAEASGHGWQYQKARQAYLRGLLQDPNQPRFVKGWVRQEMRRLQQLNRFRPKGKRRFRHLRGIPGFDVGHRLPGVHNPANFRLEHASTNRARPGISRRIGLFHKYR